MEGRGTGFMPFGSFLRVLRRLRICARGRCVAVRGACAGRRLPASCRRAALGLIFATAMIASAQRVPALPLKVKSNALPCEGPP